MVGAVKIPYEQRDVAHAHITPDDDRGFFDMIGADTHDTDPEFPVGANTTYRVDLTDEEADRFRAASNARYVELDGVTYDCVGTTITPGASSLHFMRADFPRSDQFHGRDVLIGVLDGGVTTAVANFLGATSVAKQNFSADDPGTDEVTSTHGCLVAACCIPRGGRFLDAIVSDNAGSRTVSASVAGAKWCADQGAKILNYSGAGPSDNAAFADMFQYLLDRDVQFFCSMGNDGVNQAYYPAAYSTTFTNCHSSISFDEVTGTRSSFSNYTATASGCAPGSSVLGFFPNATLQLWSGTSASSPHMALLCVMGATGGRFTPKQVGAALKANTRSTGQPAAEQGGGAYDLNAALTALGGFNNLPAQTFRRNLSTNPSIEVNTTGYSVVAKRAGFTTDLGRSSSITTPFGTNYLSINVTGNGTTSTTTPDAEIGLPTVTVTAGQPYIFSVHSRCAINGPTLQFTVRWESSSGANLGTVVGNAKSPLFNSVWARYYADATAPAGAARAVPTVRIWGFTDSSLHSWRLDGFQIEQAATLGTYFDGTTVGAIWDGLAHNSTSTVGATSGGGTNAAEYHPVAIVWPTSDKWPDDGEFDFVENSRPGDNKAEAYLHYPHPSSVPVQQEHATKAGVDLSDWHNIAFEWTPNGVKGYIDGTEWYSYSGGAIAGTRKNIQDMPKGHLTLQLDAFTGSGLTPATMEVDWVRVYPVTVSGGGGTGGGTPVTGTLADRLRLGFGNGLTKCNLGVDFLKNQGPSGKQGTHVDYPLNILTQSSLPAEFAGYCDLRDDGAVRLTAYVGGATTPNSTHSRTEFRGLAANGVDKESFTANSSTTHYVWVKGAVIRAPSGRPRICLAQVHTPDDDLCMIMYEGGTVFSTYGDTGRPGTLATSVAVNTVHQYMIKLVPGKIEFYWDDMNTPGATQSYSGGSGLYFKWGNYQQSSTATDPVGEQAVVDLLDCEVWHTGYPEPTKRH